MDNVRFRKVPFTYLPRYDEAAASEDMDGRPAPLRAVTIGDHKTVVIPGPSPTLIVKESHSLPHAFPLRNASKIRTMVPCGQQDGSCLFALVDAEGKMIQCELPKGQDYSTGWAIDKLALGDPVEEVRHVDFHQEQGMYVVATCRDVDFYFSADDTRHEHQDGESFPCKTLHTSHHFASRAYTSLLLRGPFNGVTSIVDARAIFPIYSAYLTVLFGSGLYFKGEIHSPKHTLLWSTIAFNADKTTQTSLSAPNCHSTPCTSSPPPHTPSYTPSLSPTSTPSPA